MMALLSRGQAYVLNVLNYDIDVIFAFHLTTACKLHYFEIFKLFFFSTKLTAN